MKRIYKNFNVSDDIIKKDKFVTQNFTEIGVRLNLASSSNDYKYLNKLLFSSPINYDNITVYTFDREDFKQIIDSGSFVINSTTYTITNNTNRQCLYENSIISSSPNTSIGVLIKGYGCILIYANLAHNITSSNLNIKQYQTSQLYWCRINHKQFNYTLNDSWSESVQKTYFNTIGLYDNSNNLLAVARLSKNIKKNNEESYSLKVRLSI